MLRAPQLTLVSVALSSLVITLGAVAPAYAASLVAISADEVPVEEPWAPPANAADTVPPEPNPPEEPWTPERESASIEDSAPEADASDKEAAKTDGADAVIPDAEASGVAPMAAPSGTAVRLGVSGRSRSNNGI